MTPRIAWYRTPIEKDRLRELTSRSDAKGLLHAGSFLLVYFASIAANLYFYVNQLWIPLVVGCYLHGTYASFLGMAASVHELSHGTAFKSKKLNAFFYRVFAFLSWNSYVHFKESHMKHHLYTYFQRYDWEQRSVPIPLRWWDVLSWFTFDYKKFKQLIWTNLNHAFGNTDVDFFFWCPLLSKDDIKTKKLVSWARVMLVAHLLLAAAFIVFELYILLYLVTFSAFFATFLSHATGIIQHMGLRGDVPDWRVNSYTVNFGPVMRYLYWNMNYHTEHHMYASVPFYNLPKLRKEIAWDLQKPLPGLLPALRHIMHVKRTQREDPEYRYMPEFPETATPPKMADQPV